ncbi:unnamed protein product, partial [Cylicostephanus goldi]
MMKESQVLAKMVEFAENLAALVQTTTMVSKNKFKIISILESFFGGERFSGVEFEDPVVYNITSRSWTTIAVEGHLQPAARFDHTLVRYKMRLYMFGGVIDRRNITSELWSFDLHTREWRKEGSDNTDLMVAPLSVAGHTAHVIGSEMYIFF